MLGRLKIQRVFFGLAILSLLFAPSLTYADKVADDESDHSNQDWGQPDAHKVPHPIAPSHRGAPTNGPGYLVAVGDLGLPSMGGADLWLADALTGAPQPPALVHAPVSGDDGAVEWPLVPPRVLPNGLGVPSQVSGIGGGGSGPPPVPEPATGVLLVLGGALLAVRRRR